MCCEIELNTVETVDSKIKFIIIMDLNLKKKQEKYAKRIYYRDVDWMSYLILNYGIMRSFRHDSERYPQTYITLKWKKKKN